jgi:predicted amidophosphoribosyltransferase
MRTPLPPRWLRLARRIHRGAVAPLLDVLWPSICAGCETRLGSLQRLGVCLDCWSDLHPLPRPLCVHCAVPCVPATDLLGDRRCASCPRDAGPIEAMHAVVAYDAAARRILLRAKSAGRRELLAPLAHQLGRSLVVAGYARSCSAVVAVPTHPLALLRRGFSPAAELARSVARQLDLPLLRGRLRRRLRTAASVKPLRAAERRRALDGAFRARGKPLAGRVLLVDDVVTTGATAGACAHALLRAGAAGVRVAAWARTLPRSFGPV